MCANKGGPVKPDHVNVQLSVLPSSLSFARKVPLAPLAFGGTSLKVDSRVEKRRASRSSLLLACVGKLPINSTTMAASAAHIHSFFVACSFNAPRTRRTRRDRDVAFLSAKVLFCVTIYQRDVLIVNKELIVESFGAMRSRDTSRNARQRHCTVAWVRSLWRDDQWIGLRQFWKASSPIFLPMAWPTTVELR